MLNPAREAQGEVFTGIVRKVKRKSMTHSGNPTYKIFLDNRTIDTKPDAAINYFISDSMLDKEYVFILEYGRIIGFQPMPYQPSETTTKE